MITQTIHLIADDCYPNPGGMQASVLRIARLLNRDPNIAEICVLSPITNMDDTESFADIVIHSLADKWASAAQPILDRATNKVFADANREEVSRLSFLVLRNHIQQRLTQSPESKHVILSFYLTDVGFVAQQVASSLCLPHIVAIRGSDYSRGFFCPDTIGAVEYVIRAADQIVTTNHQQRDSIERFFGVSDKVTVIYNSQTQIPSLWKRVDRPYIQLFSDSGYAHKKGTHILLDAFQALREESVPVKLQIAGRTKLSEKAFWDYRRTELKSLYPDDTNFLDYRSVQEIETHLRDADIFCSATLGEGCSQARIRALLTGMIVVTTFTGEVADLADSVPNCYTAACGDSDDYMRALRRACAAILEGTIRPATAVRYQLKNLFSEEKESALWNRVVDKVRKQTRAVRKVPRVLFYVHEGKGLGHLRRVSTVANVMQDKCSTLIVSGHRELGWLPKADCEFVHIPSLEGIDPDYLAYNGRRPFLSETRQAFTIRRDILEASVNAFEPDAIVVDYLPFGNDNEMLEILRRAQSVKYLILRGVLDNKAETMKEVFFDMETLIDVYDRVMVACDPAVIDLQAEYDLDPRLSEMLVYTGYVCTSFSSEDRLQQRVARGIKADQKWVVCSSGGGKHSEDFFNACLEVTRRFPSVRFDIVIGPRSKREQTYATNPNVVVVRETADLPLWHSACDVVISHGGYNSMVEAISAGVPVIVFPSQGEAERRSHAKRLESLDCVKVVERAAELSGALDECLSQNLSGKSPKLAMNGASVIANCILKDLS